jgi:hypothetical protein
MMVPGREAVLRQLRIFLEEELNAVRLYRDASGDVSDVERSRRLSAIARQHEAQAEELRSQIRRVAGPERVPLEEPSGWANLSKVTGTLVSGPANWNTLRERERQGLKSYRDALDNLDPASREAFLGSLIPGQFRNLCAWNDGNEGKEGIGA